MDGKVRKWERSYPIAGPQIQMQLQQGPICNAKL